MILDGVRVFDNVLSKPADYRLVALRREFRSIPVGGDVFHGISLAYGSELQRRIGEFVPGGKPTLSFFRQSPEGQVEPNYIHTDEAMGDWTAILYLNPTPAAGDGTSFWVDGATGATRGSVVGEAGKDLARWTLAARVPAAFNRMVVFDGALFHSRSIEENYGQGDDARLIQVVFGRYP